ncbi:MAG: hypothetical protein ACKO2P_01130 [Planctomycetota bacterium]
MNPPEELMNGYLDQTLTASQHADLQVWLQQSPDHVRRFTDLLMLHNQLRSDSLSFTTASHLQLSQTIMADPATAAASGNHFRFRHRLRRRMVRRVSGLAAALLLLLVCFDFLRPFGGQATATAASAELSRLISHSQVRTDRTWQIEVEAASIAGRRYGRKTAGEKRPPKPPMDHAVLHLRSGGQFVLIRHQPDGRDFISGRNATHSWAVRPGSPVRVSSDLQRFSRDLPGHEHSLSFTELSATLQQLQKSCDVQIIDGGSPADAAPQEAATAERLLIAVRRPGFQGPRRIEIAYNESSHEIHQLRFIDMPYGPERLTLRLTLTSHETLPDSFFNHSAHHPPELPVEEE